jgi:hypothetical protein
MCGSTQKHSHTLFYQEILSKVNLNRSLTKEEAQLLEKFRKQSIEEYHIDEESNFNVMQAETSKLAQQY